MGNENSGNGWKITAIIFIGLFILETALVFYSYQVVSADEEKQAICSNEICFNQNATGFNFDSSSSTCSCFKNGVMNYQEVIP